MSKFPVPIHLFSTASSPTSANGDVWYRSDLGICHGKMNSGVVPLHGQLGAYATATTAVGLTLTSIAGLSVTLPSAGIWKLTGLIPVVVVGSPTGFTLTVSPTGAPSITSMRLTVRRMDATTAWTQSFLTAFNTASTSSSMTAQTYTFVLDGAALTTSAGTYSISMTRIGGTSATTQIGSYIAAERLTA